LELLDLEHVRLLAPFATHLFHVETRRGVASEVSEFSSCATRNRSRVREL
jgi:hypothetical protein